MPLRSRWLEPPRLGPIFADFGQVGQQTHRIALLAGGIVLNALATAAYIGARFGPGPRDGLMTGLARRSGRSVRLVRTSIEGSALLLGFMLGGTLGLGTVAYALAIGPLIQAMLPVFATDALASANPVAPPIRPVAD